MIIKCTGKYLSYPCYAEPKYDGEYTIFKKGKLYNKGGVSLSSSPIISELPSYDMIIVGELYYGNGYRGDLYHLLANKKSPDLKYGIFDVIEIRGESTKRTPYHMRKTLLYNMLSDTEHTHVIRGVICSTPRDLDSAYETARLTGYEGVVAKPKRSVLVSANAPWRKMKTTETADLLVVGVDYYRQRIDVRVNDNRTCGVKVASKNKTHINIGDIVEVEHQGILSKEGLRHPVFIRRRHDKKEYDTL